MLAAAAESYLWSNRHGFSRTANVRADDKDRVDAIKAALAKRGALPMANSASTARGRQC